MNGLKATIKNMLPEHFAKKISRYHSWFYYNEYDTSDYWREKASKEGWQTIYWHNEHYNRCFDVEQKRYIKSFMEKYQIGMDEPILDIGCGIGRLCRFFRDLGYKDITGVDFSEMTQKAELENNSGFITYIPSPAQDFLVDIKFKFIISSSCFGVIRKREFLLNAIDNCTRMQGKGDYLLMIDPFHKNSYLSTARARIACKDIIQYVVHRGYKLEEKSGILFFPIKKLIEDSWDMKEDTVVRLFYLGERLLKVFSKYYFSDYKILAFKKISLEKE